MFHTYYTMSTELDATKVLMAVAENMAMGT